MTHEIEIGLLTPWGFEAAVDGERFLRVLTDELPTYAPERYGNWEPLSNEFPHNDLGMILRASWKDPFLWKRSKPRLEGSLWMGRGRQHTALHLRAQFQPSATDELWGFFTKAAVRFEVDFGYFHMFSEQQISRELDAQKTVIPLRQGLSTHDLRRCIPDLCWGTVFGPPYLALFGETCVFSSPAARVDRLGPATAFIRLTDNIRDVITDWGAFLDVRNAVKAHLGDDAFCSPERSVWRVPEFQWRLAARP